MSPLTHVARRHAGSRLNGGGFKSREADLATAKQQIFPWLKRVEGEGVIHFTNDSLIVLTSLISNHLTFSKTEVKASSCL